MKTIEQIALEEVRSGFGCRQNDEADHVQFAKSVLEAYLAEHPAVPAGWKLVPIEPTSEMIILGGEVYFDTTRLEKQGSTTFDQNSAISIYTAMLAAAPEVAK